MLVYTLKSIVDSPEDDPEVPKYLENLVKSEDGTYEVEVNQNKHQRVIH